MPFFRPPNKTSRFTFTGAKKQYPAVERIHHKRARKLYQAIKDRKLLMAAFNENKWANDFKRLENKIKKKKKQDVPVLEIDRTLDWYISKLGTRYLPVCSSAHGFYIHFWSIFSFKEQDGPYCEQISPVAKQIVKELTDFTDYPNWPGTALEQLPAAVQISLEVYSMFFDRISVPIKNQISKCKRTGGMSGRLLEHKNRKTEQFARYLDQIGPRALGCRPEDPAPLNHPDYFVKVWFHNLYKQKSDWDKWDGRLAREVWSLEHPRFQQQMLDWSDTKGGKEYWHQLMELVDEG